MNTEGSCHSIAQYKLHRANSLSAKSVASPLPRPSFAVKLMLLAIKALPYMQDRFLADVKPSNLLQTTHIYSRRQETVKIIAESESLWDSKDEMLVSLRKDVYQLILALKHHQQSGEAVVRDMGICAGTRR
jgi:hypothetical protein